MGLNERGIRIGFVGLTLTGLSAGCLPPPIEKAATPVPTSTPKPPIVETIETPPSLSVPLERIEWETTPTPTSIPVSPTPEPKKYLTPDEICASERPGATAADPAIIITEQGTSNNFIASKTDSKGLPVACFDQESFKEKQVIITSFEVKKGEKDPFNESLTALELYSNYIEFKKETLKGNDWEKLAKEKLDINDVELLRLIFKYGTEKAALDHPDSTILQIIAKIEEIKKKTPLKHDSRRVHRKDINGKEFVIVSMSKLE